MAVCILLFNFEIENSLKVIGFVAAVALEASYNKKKRGEYRLMRNRTAWRYGLSKP
jgi:hypothetical protein